MTDVVYDSANCSSATLMDGLEVVIQPFGYGT
jgi:hypothetical protein